MNIQNLKTEDLLIFATRKIQEFDEMSNDFIKIFKTSIIKLLQDNNHTKDNKLIFDGEVEDEDERNRPSCISADFDDDVTDCYINAIWLEDINNIMVEISPYYLSSEPMEVNLAELIDNNYREVLEYIICNNEKMVNKDLMKHTINLGKRGCIPSSNYNGRWSCSYGNNGINIVKHNYITKNKSHISVYDIYIKGVYDCTFDSKKYALQYAQIKDRKY